MGTMAKKNTILSNAPIIEMPNLVEVTTGEEDEEVVYSQRAKLFRYDKPSKQWKERGVGDLKILKHRSKRKSASREEIRP